MSSSNFKIDHLADLAHIELSEQEKKDLQEDLDQIIDYVDSLQEVETKKAGSLSNVTGISNVQREDEIRSSEKQKQRRKMRAQFLTQRNRYLGIPRVLNRD